VSASLKLLHNSK